MKRYIEYNTQKVKCCIDTIGHDIIIDGNVIICLTCGYTYFREMDSEGIIQ